MKSFWHASILLCILFIECSTPDPGDISTNEDDYLQSYENQIVLSSIDSVNQLNGLWTCVRSRGKGGIERDKTEFDKHDYFFKNGLKYEMQYPCNRNPWRKQVSLKSDSLILVADQPFFSRESFRGGFMGDTLVQITKNSVRYFKRIQYDTQVVEILINTSFNPDCINGEWELQEISNGHADEISLDDKRFKNIPQSLDIDNFQCEGYYIKSDTFYLKSDNAPMFHFHQLDNWSTDPLKWLVHLWDVPRKDEVENSFTYILKKPRWKLNHDLVVD